MIKYQEISDPNSCWNKARNDENLFVLLARDITFPKTVRFWIAERIKSGKNKPGDKQILEAERLAEQVEGELKTLGRL